MHIDHCRIGSLENLPYIVKVRRVDHCRIGSLESIQEMLK